MNKLGKELKELRISHHITLRQFAKILDIQPSRLAAIENGRVDEEGHIRSLTEEELINKLPVFIKKSAIDTDEKLNSFLNKIRIA